MTSKAGLPGTLRTDIMPIDGYVLSVDGKLKAKFESSEEALAAGLKLKRAYPFLQIQMLDAAAQSYVPVLLPDPVLSPET
jgi:heat shock protein HspQ